MKYKVVRTDTADALIRKIVLYVTENFDNDTALEKLDELEDVIMSLGDNPKGKYATMKDGRTIYVTKLMESGTEFTGNEISRARSPEVTATVSDIDHIAKCKAIMPKA